MRLGKAHFFSSRTQLFKGQPCIFEPVDDVVHFQGLPAPPSVGPIQFFHVLLDLEKEIENFSYEPKKT